MSEANDHLSPSQQRNMDYDFSNLPDLPLMDQTAHQSGNTDVPWNLDDFFSTDVPMPSSPPRMFHLYEDPTAISNVNWSQFSHFDDRLLNDSTNNGNKEVEIKEEPSDEQQALMDAQELPEHPEQSAGQVTELSTMQAVEQRAKSPKEKSATEEPAEEPAEKPTDDPAEEDEVDMVGMGKLS
jgi:hypothetical protein